MSSSPSGTLAGWPWAEEEHRLLTRTQRESKWLQLRGSLLPSQLRRYSWIEPVAAGLADWPQNVDHCNTQDNISASLDDDYYDRTCTVQNHISRTDCHSVYYTSAENSITLKTLPRLEAGIPTFLRLARTELRIKLQQHLSKLLRSRILKSKTK